jgi:D-amino-acid oxidase
LDTEQVGDKLVVHNYGHGGSGWSLSWGTSSYAVQKAMAASPREVAVIGCGIIGLTSAILAQSAGVLVTIYTRELLPATRSWRATGSWKTAFSNASAADNSSISSVPNADEIARISFKTHRRYMDLPGSLVVSKDYFYLSDVSVTRSTAMVFNIADYGDALMRQFRDAGGQIQTMEFHEPSDLARLKEGVIINCPGYGGRALWHDRSIIPVRGQIAWLSPQPEVDYGLAYRNFVMLSRRDGIAVQTFGPSGMTGYDDDNESPDRAEADGALASVAALYSRLSPPRGGGLRASSQARL